MTILYLRKLNQSRRPKLNDRVKFFHQDLETWVEATLISDALRGWRHYYNIVYDNGREDGVYLTPNKRWTLLEHDHGVQHDMQQVDGGDEPESLTPSPNTSPDQETIHTVTGTREKTRLNFAEYLSNDSSYEFSRNILDKSRTESMDWDNLGTDLESPPRFFNLPTLEINLDRATNLEHCLPLSSTPLSPRKSQCHPQLSSYPNSPRRPRISRLRRSLPLEIEEGNPEDNAPAFLSRLNPFRKKKPKNDH